MLLKIGITAVLIIGWHFPTTFFVPGGPPHVVDGVAVWLALSQGDALTRLAAP